MEICNLSSINKPNNVMLLLNSIGILLIVIFNLIDESEFLILNIIAVDFCIFTGNYLYIAIHIIDLDIPA